jgi:hypothetical protein
MNTASNRQSTRFVFFPGTFHQQMFLFDARHLPVFDAFLISGGVSIKKPLVCAYD